MDKLNKKVKLSFIIPAYNCENYLRKCVESIIQQNIKSYEILIINDGSTDATLDIALQLEKEYIDYVKVYSQTNNGAAAARNSGLRLSSGEYIVFVDSDDMIYGNSLDKCISKMEENNVDILLSNMSIYVNDKIKINEAGF